jgi:hypothetical protein
MEKVVINNTAITAKQAIVLLFIPFSLFAEGFC